MGEIYTYFAAKDDDAAAAVFAEVMADRSLVVPEGGALTEIEPFMQLTQMVARLGGPSGEELQEDPRWGAAVATDEASGSMACSYAMACLEPLAAAEPEQLRQALLTWYDEEEFWEPSEEELAPTLADLTMIADLARTSRDHGYPSIYTLYLF